MEKYFRATIDNSQVVFKVRDTDSAVMCSQMFVRRPGNLCSVIDMDKGLTITPVAPDYWSGRERCTVDSSILGGDEKLCRFLGFRYLLVAEALKYIDKANNPGFPARKVLHKIRSLPCTEDIWV